MTCHPDNTSTWSTINKSLDIRDEFRLLLLCACTNIEQPQGKLIREITQKKLDWEFILNTARVHALIPLLYRNIDKFCSDLVPSTVVAQLKSEYLTIAEHNRVVTMELLDLLNNLKSAGISAVPYKGPALAALAYGDITLRKFYDLDVVIRRRDIISAKSFLVSRGYQWRPFQGQLTGRNESKNFHIWHEYTFVHPEKAPVDLHWRISAKRFPFNIDLDELWEHLEPAHLLDEDIRVFPPEVLLLFLCVHGTKDTWWRRIGWICDIGELLTSNPDLDWSYSLDLATKTGTRRILLLGTALAHELLQTHLPDQVGESIRSDNVMQKLLKQVIQRLFDETASDNQIVEILFFRIRVRERLRDRIPVYQHLIKTLFAMAFVPNREDHKLIKLPSSLSVLYYLVRPVRLTQKLWSHTIRGNNKLA